MLIVMGVLKHPSAFLPLVMSFVVVAAGLREAAAGMLHQADEGTAAHLFQLLMPAQVPIVGYFAITYVPRAPKPALLVLALQLGAALAILAAVRFLT